MNDKILTEGNYRFDFTNCLNVCKADMPTYNGLCGVDFIAEMEDKYLFVEVKNIDNPNTPKEERLAWIEHLKSKNGRDFLLDMGVKFKDTVLRKWANEEIIDKPVWFIVILQFKEVDAAIKIRLAENLSGYLPTCFTERNGFKRTIKIGRREIININDWQIKYPQISISET